MLDRVDLRRMFSGLSQAPYFSYASFHALIPRFRCDCDLTQAPYLFYARSSRSIEPSIMFSGLSRAPYFAYANLNVLIPLFLSDCDLTLVP
jgi:hypothetical protein